MIFSLGYQGNFKIFMNNYFLLTITSFFDMDNFATHIIDIYYPFFF